MHFLNRAISEPTNPEQVTTPRSKLQPIRSKLQACNSLLILLVQKNLVQKSMVQKNLVQKNMVQKFEICNLLLIFSAFAKDCCRQGCVMNSASTTTNQQKGRDTGTRPCLRVESTCRATAHGFAMSSDELVASQTGRKNQPVLAQNGRNCSWEDGAMHLVDVQPGSFPPAAWLHSEWQLPQSIVRTSSDVLTGISVAAGSASSC